MRKLIAITLRLFLFGGVAFADDFVTLKQGALLRWDSEEGGAVENLSTVTLARTKPIESLGKWNALWDGLTLDAGFSYDAQTFDSVAILIGRDFGTLGKYLPIEFPYSDRIQITLYPFGIIVDDPTSSFDVSGASGIGIVKFEVGF